MKIGTIMQQGEQHLAVITERGVLDVTSYAKANQLTSYPSADDVIAGGQAAVEQLQALVSQAEAAQEYWHAEDAVTWGPALTRPGKIICVGLNYRKHAIESKMAIPETPVLFSKFNNALAGHGWDVPIPEGTDEVDYEAELGIVIGQTARNVAIEDALNYVFGYCNTNDLSARDWQLRTPQWLLGKTPDYFCPVGPYVVTADEVGNPNQLGIKCIVNGEVRQNSNTSDMIFYCDEIVSYISKHFTLEPGDPILTGTPEGVVFGYPKEEQVYLKPGDVVTIEIEKLGSLTNTMVVSS